MDEFNSSVDNKEKMTAGEEPYIQRPSQKYGRTAYQQQSGENSDIRGPQPYEYEGFCKPGNNPYRSGPYRRPERNEYESGYRQSGEPFRYDGYDVYGRPIQSNEDGQAGRLNAGDPYAQPVQPNPPYGNSQNGQPVQPNPPYGNSQSGQPVQPNPLYGNSQNGQPVQPNPPYGNGGYSQTGGNPPYGNSPYQQPYGNGSYGQPNWPYGNPPYGNGLYSQPNWPQEKAKEPVSNVYAYILMALVAVAVVISLLNYKAVFEVMEGLQSFDYGAVLAALQNDAGYSMLALLSQCVTLVTIVFLVLDIVKIYRANYKITGLILFAIFLRPAYFIWRAYLLRKNKALPIVFTVLAYGTSFLMLCYLSYQMALEIMYAIP